MNPGQYHDNYQNLDKAYPSGEYEVNEVKVDFDRRDEHKSYNVQAKAGDFIIGEVGKIDVNNGQTVEVSYDLVDMIKCIFSLLAKVGSSTSSISKKMLSSEMMLQ